MNSLELSSPSLSLEAMQESLEKQLQLCRGFLCLLQEEQNALAAMDLEGLMRFSRKKVELLDHIHQLDAKLSRETAGLAAEHHGEARTLTELIPLLPGPAAGRFDQFRTKLTRLREEIMLRNRINKEFSEATLRSIGDAISLIAGGGRRQPSYAAPGAPAPTTSNPAFLSREV